MAKSSLAYVIPTVLGFAWTLFWCFDRLRAYFAESLSVNVQGFKAAVLPADASDSVARSFSELVVRPFYAEKSTAIRLHIVTGTLCSIGIMLQLIPYFSTHWPAFHKTLGYCVVAALFAFVVEALYTMFVVGMAPLGWPVLAMDCVSVSCVIVGVPQGLSAMTQRRDVQAHRKWMTLAAAGTLINPVMRFVWSLLAKANIMGPYSSWEIFRDGVTVLASGVTVVLNLTVWALFVYMTDTAEHRKTA